MVALNWYIMLEEWWSELKCRKLWPIVYGSIEDCFTCYVLVSVYRSQCIDVNRACVLSSNIIVHTLSAWSFHVCLTCSGWKAVMNSNSNNINRWGQYTSVWSSTIIENALNHNINRTVQFTIMFRYFEFRFLVITWMSFGKR